MMASLTDMLFGCWHTNYSFPISIKNNPRQSEAARTTGHYIVCLDCGKEFAYDWQEMRVVTTSTPFPNNSVLRLEEVQK